MWSRGKETQRLSAGDAAGAGKTDESENGRMRLIDTLCVELTSRCPLRCVHCSANASPERAELLDIDVLSRRLAELGTLTEVYLSGGEPLEHPRVLDAVRASRRVAGVVVLYSSGVVLRRHRTEAIPREMLANLSEEGVSRVDLSFYSADPTLHDQVTRTPGSFALALESAGRICAAGIPLGIHFVPVCENDQFGGVAALAERLGAASLHVLAVARQGRASLLPARRADHGFLHELRALVAASDLPFALVVSSVLRAELGDRAVTPRDRLRAALVDVRGFLYPGEGWRLPQLRSQDSLTTPIPITALIAEVSPPA